MASWRNHAADWISKHERLLRICMAAAMATFLTAIVGLWIARFQSGFYRSMVVATAAAIAACFGAFIYSTSRWDIHKLLVVMSVFLFAFAVRIGIVSKTRGMDAMGDLSIYVDGGQLLSNNVNPYDFTSGREIRERLRTDTHAHSEFVDVDQKTWDQYARSNLPLTLLVFGVVDVLSDEPVIYRTAFAFFDAVLSGLIVLMLCPWWMPESRVQPKRLAMAVLLGALSPLLLLWGTCLPEDKGIQILLMLLAIHTSRSSNSRFLPFLSAFFLGASVAFKGLGIFIAPACFHFAVFKGRRLSFALLREKAAAMALYTGVSVIATFFWFAPFMADVLGMMKLRMASNLVSVPQHASPWVLAHRLLPSHWGMIEYLFIALFLGITLWGVAKARLPILIASTNLLLCFVHLMLLGSSMDRIQMAILTAVIAWALVDLPVFKRLAVGYIALGLAVLALIVLDKLVLKRHFGFRAWSEFSEGVLALGFTVGYLITTLGFILSSRKPLALEPSVSDQPGLEPVGT